MKFQDAFTQLLTFEGTSFTQTSGDAGGKTKYGISQNAYPTIDIENLTESQAMSIYGTDYWLKCKIQYLPESLQYIVFDTAVNCGPGTAVMMLQKLSSVSVDGVIGQHTIDACQKVTIQMYADARKSHYNDIILHNPEDGKFRTGWFNRVDKIVELYTAPLN
jgi:lysozyme family protein